jgi:hypothetical protein
VALLVIASIKHSSFKMKPSFPIQCSPLDSDQMAADEFLIFSFHFQVLSLPTQVVHSSAFARKLLAFTFMMVPSYWPSPETSELTVVTSITMDSICPALTLCSQ